MMTGPTGPTGSVLPAHPREQEEINMLIHANQPQEDKLKAEVERLTKALADPVPMRMPCPTCGQLHEDIGRWSVTPHHTHACQFCGMVWRPAIRNTVGVKFLPGFRNTVPERDEDDE